MELFWTGVEILTAALGGAVMGVMILPVFRFGPRATLAEGKGWWAPLEVGACALLCLGILIWLVVSLDMRASPVATIGLLLAAGLCVWSWYLALPRLHRAWLQAALQQAQEDLTWIPSCDMATLQLFGTEARTGAEVFASMKLAAGAERLLEGTGDSPFRGEWLYARLRVLTIGPLREEEDERMALARSYWTGRVRAFKLLMEFSEQRQRAESGAEVFVNVTLPQVHPAQFEDGMKSVIAEWGARLSRTLRIVKRDSEGAGEAP
jgi:hypothetical protein